MTRDQKVAEAKRLREGGLSYSVVGQRLGVSPATAWKWLNPDAARAMGRRSNAQQGPAKRAWEN
jgi:transposase